MSVCVECWCLCNETCPASELLLGYSQALRTDPLTSEATFSYQCPCRPVSVAAYRRIGRRMARPVGISSLSLALGSRQFGCDNTQGPSRRLNRSQCSKVLLLTVLPSPTGRCPCRQRTGTSWPPVCVSNSDDGKQASEAQMSERQFVGRVLPDQGGIGGRAPNNIRTECFEVRLHVLAAANALPDRPSPLPTEPRSDCSTHGPRRRPVLAELVGGEVTSDDLDLVTPPGEDERRGHADNCKPDQTCSNGVRLPPAPTTMTGSRASGPWTDETGSIADFHLNVSGEG